MQGVNAFLLFIPHLCHCEALKKPWQSIWLFYSIKFFKTNQICYIIFSSFNKLTFLGGGEGGIIVMALKKIIGVVMRREKGFIGFTLAEVLITLTIIGVVAALTIPNLYANYQKQQYVTQLKKVYTELSQSLKLLMADEGVNKITDSDTLTFQEGEDIVTITQRVGDNFFKKYFKVIKDCGTGDGCFANNYRYIAGGENIADPEIHYAITIANGASIGWHLNDSLSAIYPSYFVVDINGLKSPNIVGRDLFTLSYYYDGSIDSIDVTPECRKGKPTKTRGDICVGQTNASNLRQNFFEVGCLTNGYNYGLDGCFGKILNDNWKMDY